MQTNFQMIQKGRISSVEGSPDRNGDLTAARVVPDTASDIVTRPLVIPWWLRGKMGELKQGVSVAYAMFEDGTGLILSRMDGEWSGTVIGNVEIINGNVNVPNGDVIASDISLKGHIHTAPDGVTSTPN